MFIPIGDDNRDRRTTPLIVYLLILVNLFVWSLQLTLGETFTVSYAAVPFEISRGIDLVTSQTVTIQGETIQIPQGPGPHPLWLTLFTAMFMHGSWMHLIGNMVYLGIFGDQIEDRLGHIRFLIFYIAAGLVASVAQIEANPTSVLPNLGASGAIAGVLGAYLVLYPHNRVKVLLIRDIALVPASLVLGLWVFMQFLGEASVTHEEGGVAYMAHIGGFVVGFCTGMWLRLSAPVRRRS